MQVTARLKLKLTFRRGGAQAKSNRFRTCSTDSSAPPTPLMSFKCVHYQKELTQRDWNLISRMKISKYVKHHIFFFYYCDSSPLPSDWTSFINRHFSCFIFFILFFLMFERSINIHQPGHDGNGQTGFLRTARLETESNAEGDGTLLKPTINQERTTRTFPIRFDVHT